MTEKNMDQIRDLLIGEFVGEYRNQMQFLEDKLSEIEERHRKDIDQLSTLLTSRINQLDKTFSERFDYLEESINKKIKENGNLHKIGLDTLRDEVVANKENADKFIDLLKQRIEKSLRNLKDDYTSKNVSKKDLASMFFEYSLKLKGESIEESVSGQRSE